MAHEVDSHGDHLMDRERRRKGVATRIVNTPVAKETHAFLKSLAEKRRVAIGVILDEWAALEAAKQPPREA